MSFAPEFARRQQGRGADPITFLEGTSEPSADVSWIAIPTCERPRLFRRLLQSLIKAGIQDLPKLRLLVVDDSRTELSTRLNRSALRDAGLPALYVDRNTRAALAKKLPDEPASKLIAWLLLGSPSLPTYGASQNTILLLSKGTSTLCLDDDVCADRLVSGPRGHEITESEHPEAVYFYDDSAPLPKGERCRLVDLLGEVRSALQVGQRADRRALIAAIGLVGDPGTHSWAQLLSLANRVSHQNAHRSNYHYRLARRTRRTLRVALQSCEAPLGAFMSAAYGINNRLPVLPFFPELRGSDATFGRLTGSAFPDYTIHYLPYALRHEPLDKRTFDEDMVTLRFSTLLRIISVRHLPDPSSVASVFSAFRDFVDCGEGEFVHRLHDLCSDHYRQQLGGIEASLGSHGFADAAIEDLVGQTNRIALRLSTKDFSVHDLPGNFAEQAHSVKGMIGDWLAGCALWMQLERNFTIDPEGMLGNWLPAAAHVGDG